MDSGMFKKVGCLRKGSYTTVHRATNPSGDTFAVKSSPLDKSSWLQKERRIYAKLINCPEILHCFSSYRSFEEGKVMFNLVLEYAPEGSLRNFMNRYAGRRLPESDVRDFTRMILRGLSLIHWSGYVHCDLKLDNILVFMELECNLKVVKQLKLADFKLAKEPEESGENPYSWGTLRYMSPELVLTGQLGPKLDIWSLGCSVIEMVTGRRVYDAITDKNELKWKTAVLKEAPKIPENLSELGKNFLMRCLAIDPEERWSADDLLRHPFVATCGVSRELNPGEYFAECSIEGVRSGTSENPKKPWIRKLKQSSVIGTKLKASGAYLKSWFGKSAADPAREPLLFLSRKSRNQ